MAIHNIDFSPRILYEALGYKNIEVDSIAFAEQIKNSRDAKAKNITLNFSHYNNKISIIDDGIGMDEEDLKRNWLLVGTQSKISDKNALGGKGIGRFSIFRIANNITIITKKKSCPEYELSLKKDDLEILDNMLDFEVEIIENKDPKFFKSSTSSGTKIILTDLKQINFHEVFEDLYNLIQPDSIDKPPIKINYIYPNFFDKPYVIDVDKAINYAPFCCKATFKENYLVNYDFKCIANGNTLYKNTNPQGLSKLFGELSHVNLGNINFYLYNYYFHSTFINLLNVPKDDLQNNFLNIYQGISIYRESFKIYGHGKVDWLKLAEQRVNRPSKKIDNRLSFGYVVLERPNSDLLEEKTSREGFLKGEALDYLISSLNLIIDTFNKDREESINIISKNNFSNIINILKSDKNSKNKKKANNHVEIHEKNIGECHPSINPSTGVKNENHNKRSADNADNNENNSPNPESTVIEENLNINPPTPKPAFSRKKVIDASFVCPNTAPEKIKRIIHELQTINSNSENAQGLLLRCLIDISTKYAQHKLNIIANSDNLNSNILSVLNIISDKKLIDHKHIRRIRDTSKKQSFSLYLNGVAHEYDYRPNFKEVKEFWNIFEPYVSFCIKQ